jgi:hypothetical protein
MEKYFTWHAVIAIKEKHRRIETHAALNDTCALECACVRVERITKVMDTHVGECIGRLWRAKQRQSHDLKNQK